MTKETTIPNEPKSLEDQIKEILANSTGDIQNQIQRQLKESVIENLTWNLREKLTDIVSAFIANDMAEDIKIVMAEARPIILQELRNGIAHIAAGIGTHLITTANKNLESSYKVTKIVEGLFD